MSHHADGFAFRWRVDAGPVSQFGLHCSPMGRAPHLWTQRAQSQQIDQRGIVADVEEPRLAWRKSSASQTTDCAEVANTGGSVLIRDSKSHDGAVLRVTPAAWFCFLADVRTGDSLPA